MRYRRDFPPRGKGPIFDVGGGNGFVAKGLMDAGWDVVLVEPGPAGARNAKKRGVQHVVCATTQSAGFRQGSMPAIGVFDVVEHIEDDVAFLRHLHDLLEPGGMLYLTVPAYNFLWSEADVEAGHLRRYTSRKLSQRLQALHFEVCFATYFFRILPLTVFIFRLLPYRLGLTSNVPEATARDHGIQNGLLASAMRSVLSPESGSIAGARRMAFGSSCLIAARKNAVIN